MIKIKAGALQLTLFIGVVIVLLLTAFIILTSTYRKINIASDMTIETVKNVNKGIDYALLNDIKLKDTTILRLDEHLNKNVKIARDFWGLFEKISVVSSIQTKTFAKTALIGNKKDNEQRVALFLQDHNKPLVLVSDTKIQGNAHLPLRGVKPGNISGVSYYGDQLIYGQIETAKSFPKLKRDVLKHLTTLDEFPQAIASEQMIHLSNKQTYKNSFFKPLKYAFSLKAINLSHVSLTGHIMVVSKTKIVVSKSAHLKDVILVAPKIELEDGVSGTFQAVASSELLVGEYCKLSYPSALVLSEKSSESDHSIYIGKHASVEGMVVFIGKERLNNTKAQVVIDETAEVVGEIYCNQNFELKGSVLGTVYTSNFIANQSGSIYQNHLYKARILANELSEEYIGLPLEKKQKGVLKWLY